MVIFEPGDIVADIYRLEECVGSGGMGAVWRATHLKLFGRQVALKFIHPTAAQNEHLRTNLATEAATLSRLDHPNICPILDFGHEKIVLFLAMGFVDGSDLAAVIRAGTLPVPLALYVTAEILRALQHAHERGVIHRDMKPSNVLVARTGAIKVTDFGIAKAFPPGQVPSTSTFAAGSLGYMAPEILRGTGARFQTDVFGVGVTLFEMLTGRSPFNSAGADREQIFHATLTTPVPTLASVGVQAPPAIDYMLQRSVAKDPAERYATATEFLEELSPILLSYGRDAMPEAWRRFLTSSAQTQVFAPPAEQRAPASRPSIGVSNMAGQLGGGDRPRASTNNQRPRRRIPAVATASASITIAVVAVIVWNGATSRAPGATGATPHAAQPAPPAPDGGAAAPRRGQLQIRVSPRDATVRVDGKRVDGDTVDVTLGTRVLVEATHDEYEPGTADVAVNSELVVVPLELLPKRTAPPIAVEEPTATKPTPPPPRRRRGDRSPLQPIVPKDSNQ